MCSDPATLWYPARIVCYAEMAQQAAAKTYDENAEKYGRKFHDGQFKTWHSERTDATPFPHDAGVTIVVTREDMTPGEDFLAPPTD